MYLCADIGRRNGIHMVFTTDNEQSPGTKLAQELASLDDLTQELYGDSLAELDAERRAELQAQLQNELAALRYRYYLESRDDLPDLE